ncbi:APC family permease [Quadrisphaera oryzae]|uniref:APC family permease n=1 Tax=Quadrisphaera TaxID=317661 RepID=UPI001C984E44|nr:APC family permease [Quadrisphaera sp. RL12-1S]
MGAAFPDVPSWVWIGATIVICTALNLAGVQLAARVNVLLVAVQVVVAGAFVVLVVKAVLDGPGAQAFTLAPFGAGQDVGVGGLAAGAAILALSFLGFDAVSTLAEEAERPRRDLPRAIFIIVAVASVFFVGVTYTMQSLFPDVSQLADVVGASPEIALYIGGPAFQAFFLAGYLVAVLGCGVTQQMSAARLLYAMGRDGVLPRGFFGRVSVRTGVPVANTLLVALLACTAVFIDLAQAASVINFGAFVAFVAVNASVVLVAVRFVRGSGAGPRGGLLRAAGAGGGGQRAAVHQPGRDGADAGRCLDGARSGAAAVADAPVPRAPAASDGARADRLSARGPAAALAASASPLREHRRVSARRRGGPARTMIGCCAGSWTRRPPPGAPRPPASGWPSTR